MLRFFKKLVGGRTATPSLHQRALERLLRAEAEFGGYEALIHEDVPLWPLVRDRLWRSLVSDEREHAEPRASLPAFSADSAAVDTGVDVTLPVFVPPEVPAPKGRDRLMLVERPTDRKPLTAERNFNYVMDPLVWSLADEFDPVKFCFSKMPPDARKPLVPMQHVHLAETDKKPPPFDAELTVALEHLVEIVRKTLPDFSLNGGELRSEIGYIRTRENQITALLIKERIRAIGLSCHYHYINRALIYAARRLGLPVIDVAHGIRNPFNGPDTNIPSLPSPHYAILPSHFWCWDAVNASNVTKAWPWRARRHSRSFVGGYPLANMWGARPQEQKPWALLTLAPESAALPDFFLDALVAAPEWTCLLRAHPTAPGQAHHIWERLSTCLKPRVDVVTANTAPLGQLLNHSAIHFTKYSSVALEALYHGCPSVVLSATGATNFRYHVQKRHLQVALDRDSVLACLTAIKSTGLENTSRHSLSQPIDGKGLHRLLFTRDSGMGEQA